MATPTVWYPITPTNVSREVHGHRSLREEAPARRRKGEIKEEEEGQREGEREGGREGRRGRSGKTEDGQN